MAAFSMEVCAKVQEGVLYPCRDLVEFRPSIREDMFTVHSLLSNIFEL